MPASPLPLLVLPLLLIRVVLLVVGRVVSAATVTLDAADADDEFEFEFEFDDDDVADQNPPEAFVTISDNFVATMGSSQSSQRQSCWLGRLLCR